MHSLFSVSVNVYSTECRLFAGLGELPAEGLPQVTEILPDFFRGKALCSCLTAPESYCPPGRDLPLQLADEAMRAGRKGGRDK